MLKGKNVFVTGAAGFIGANLVRKLIKFNNRVHIFIKKSTDLWRLKDILNKIHIHYSSLEEPKQLIEVFQQYHPQIIYHLAAYGTYPNQSEVSEMIKTNILGTANLISSLNSFNYECFINTGSSSEYGLKNKPMQENDLLEPVSFYGITKVSSTYLCCVFAKTYQKPIITLRPFSVYGPYEKPTRLIPTLISRISQNKLINLTIKNITRDFIYIDDLIDCYLQIPSVINPKIYGEVFNIGTGQQYSNEAVAYLISRLIKKQVRIKFGAYPTRAFDTHFWVADITKIKKILQWKPKYKLQDGLKKTILWFKNHEEVRKIYKYHL